MIPFINRFLRSKNMDITTIKALLSNSVIENATSFFVNGIISEISAHCATIAKLQASGDLSADKLEDANTKLLSLIQALHPALDFIASKYPELAPVISLAENYANIKNS